MTIEVDLPLEHVLERPREAEVDDLLALVHACDIASIGFADFTADDVREWLSAPFTKPDVDGWTVRDRHGGLVAWAYIDSSYGERKEDGIVYVHPDADPALFRPLIDLLVQRSAERATAADRADHDLLIVAVNDPPLERAAAAAGAHKARTFARMRRELDGTEGGLPIPEGVTVTGIDPDDEVQMREFHAVYTESFASHFGFEPSSYEAWRAHLSNAAGTPYDQWRAGHADGAMVGVMQAADMTAEGGGWVRNLGVRPAYRGRGVARTLLDQAFAVFHDRGFTWAGLGVDIANETGAYRLYESVGMDVLFKADYWELTVPAATPVG
jgi:mycothiol synthase